MPGHLFVVRGDIRNIACTAWLLPTDAGRYVERRWREGQPRLAGVGDIEPTGDWYEGSRVARALEPSGASGAVWLGNVGGDETTARDWILAPVSEFVRRAAATEPAPDPRVRDRPLLAIPFVGTGEAGMARDKGDAAISIVERLEPLLDELDVDVAVVLRDDAAFAAMQHARRMRWEQQWSAALDPTQLALADRLAGHARRRRLVFFVGAGVSAGAGLPQWNALLEDLAKSAEVDVAALGGLGPLDKATVIETALATSGRRLGEEVAKLLPGSGPHTLTHALIASLPTDEAVTTNYDQLLERAARDAQRPFTVLDGAVAGADRWLLKLHGDLGRPQDIVLSRDDYLGYGQRRAALRGIVQAMLITRHMVFAGFGMSDDNFHAIIHDVRTALSDGGGSRPFGTALLVQDRPLFKQLWRDDIEAGVLGGADEPIGVGARRLEVLLDRVLSESTGALSHFMDPAFEALLDPADQRLREALAEASRTSSTDTPAGRAFAEFLEQLGQRPPTG